jgi:hypothetical protein
MPTTAFYTLSYFSVTQGFVNVSQTVLDSDEGQSALKFAVSSSLSTKSLVNVSVVKVEIGTLGGRRYLSTASSTAVYSIFYSVTVETDDGDAVYQALKLQLISAVEHKNFTQYLHEAALSFNIPSLLFASVNTSSLSVSEPVVYSSHSPVPTASPSNINNVNDDSRRRTILGIVIGVGAPVAAGLFAPVFVNEKIIGTYGIITAALCTVILGLVLAWATDNDSSDALSSFGFLGRPDWESNPFAYHPLLMVAGYYLSVVLLSLGRAFVSERIYGMMSSVLFGTAATCFVIGCCAVVKRLHVSGAPSLTSLHSWLGIVSAVCFLACVAGRLVELTGAVPAETTPESFEGKYGSKVDILQLSADLVTLAVTTLTILTGISMQVGQCYYVDASYGTDADPAAHYAALPTACKISFGLGILVIVASVVTATVVINSKQWSTPKPVTNRGVECM